MSASISSWGSAAEILASSGVPEKTSYYREFTREEQKAVLTIGMRIEAAWAANDAEMFASVFTEDGSLLMRDEQLTSRSEIRAYMARGFGGPYKGARVTGWPLLVKFLGPDAALFVTQGGILLAGEEIVHPDREIRAVWVVVRRGPGKLELLSHQSSPIRG
ncbi:MAG: SgcJ/EcaC family oxidoreductase [Actinobacteria bacterium]|nr:SgcJ/EcaC family oxidoreductase [Actinomycetota bacterium]